MQFRVSFAIIASWALAFTHAFEVPAEDGMYAIEKDAEGNEHAVFIAPLNMTAPTKTMVERAVLGPKLGRRDQYGCEYQNMISQNVDHAVANLKLYCGISHTYHSAKMIWLSGGMLAYTCDYSGGQHCSSDEATLAYTLITNTCGSYKSGWWMFGNTDMKAYGIVPIVWHFHPKRNYGNEPAICGGI
ncbi:hypothetical protein B0H66DRAFT_608791 [Apodospora peruviana]|uniref:Uncharacterized protein n=1 Tax=Apodospora peruviana TaxID=516989 RepID=A0AAE0LYP2_9PEZI|nr:hypothetical protein B0H66DRAFT_608791 [Apodospora peruviana]